MDGDHIFIEYVGKHGAQVPEKAHEDDAAFDLFAFDNEYLEPGDTCTVPTGIKIALPYGCAGLVLPRSGLAAKHSVTVLNAPGLIDAGYRGEVKVILHNCSRLPYEVRRGDRIAQLLPIRLSGATLWKFVGEPYHSAFDVEEGSELVRGEGGFGSTGR